MSFEQKALIGENFTRTVKLCNNAIITINISEQEETVEFIYVNQTSISKYCITHKFNDKIFCNILPHFIKYTFEELLNSKEYDPPIENESYVEITFKYKVLKRNCPILVKLNLKDCSTSLTTEGNASDIDEIKAQNKLMRAEIAIMKNILAQNNKPRITLSTISDSYFSCKNPNDTHILRIPDDFINKVNSRVTNDFAKILSVKVRKIKHMVKIDVELELYSKECQYYLCYQYKTDFKKEILENFTDVLNQSKKSIFFGSGNIMDKFTYLSKNTRDEIIGVYLILYDRRDFNIKKLREDNVSLSETMFDLHHECYFLDDAFPINNYCTNFRSREDIINEF